MRATLLVCAALAALVRPAAACGNDEEHQLYRPPDPVEDVLDGHVFTHSRKWDEHRAAEMHKLIAQARTDVERLAWTSVYWDNLALSLIRLGRAEEALAVLDDKDAVVAAAAAMPEESRQRAAVYSAGNRGTAWLALGDERKAKAAFQAAIAASPDAHGGREWMHVKLMQYELNLEVYPALVSADFLGTRYFPAERHEELAMGLADLVLNGSRPQDDVHIYFALGRLLEHDPGEAKRAYRRAEVLGHPHARAALARLGATDNDIEYADRQWSYGSMRVRTEQNMEVAKLEGKLPRRRRR